MAVLRTVIWKSLTGPSLEYFSLLRAGSSFRGEGTVLKLEDGVPLKVQYAVTCDAAWRTRQLTVSLRSGETERKLHLGVDGRQGWWQDGREVAALRGCVDVDLSITPFTNTLPIRRFGLAVGETRELIAAWVRFPELTLAPLSQRYTCLAKDRYLYENTDGSFSAELRVDDLWMVTTYAGGWERISHSS